jgi:hypothetical protein
MDGLLNFFNITPNLEEEDSLVSTINAGSSLVKADWIGDFSNIFNENDAFCLSSMETYNVYSFTESLDAEAINGWEDMRQQLGVDYVAEVFPDGSLLAGKE